MKEIANRKRFNILRCGRRWGKDIQQIDYVGRLAISGNPTAWYAPSYKQLLDDWRMVVAKLQPVTFRKSEQEHRLDLLGGGSIEFWSLVDPDSSRGRKYRAVTINEAGLMKNLSYAWNNVISPTLIDYRGGAMFAFTPKGMNDIYHLEMNAVGDPTWNITHESSYMNPHIPVDELDLRKKTLPEQVYNQEILAEYIADSGMVFRKVMTAAVITEPIKPLSGHQYVIGVDWGKSNDFTVITVLDIDTKEMCAFDRFNQIDYNLQIGRLMAWVDRYHPVMVYPEANSMGGLSLTR